MLYHAEVSLTSANRATMQTRGLLACMHHT